MIGAPLRGAPGGALALWPASGRPGAPWGSCDRQARPWGRPCQDQGQRRPRGACEVVHAEGAWPKRVFSAPGTCPPSEPARSAVTSPWKPGLTLAAPRSSRRRSRRASLARFAPAAAPPASVSRPQGGPARVAPSRSPCCSDRGRGSTAPGEPLPDTGPRGWPLSGAREETHTGVSTETSKRRRDAWARRGQTDTAAPRARAARSSVSLRDPAPRPQPPPPGRVLCGVSGASAEAAAGRGGAARGCGNPAAGPRGRPAFVRAPAGGARSHGDGPPLPGPGSAAPAPGGVSFPLRPESRP